MTAAQAFRRGAVNDGNEIRGDDDSVLASLCGILRDDGLLYYFHVTNGASETSEAFEALHCLCTRRNTGAGPASPQECVP